MQRLIARFILLAILVAAAGAVAGDTYSVGGLTVERPWARATAGPAKTAAAYLTIRNIGKADDRLVGVAAGAVAGKAMLHTHVMEGAVMRMRHVDGIVVEAGATAMLAPGGDHVMLMDLKMPLKEGRRFSLTLTFEKAGSVTVEVAVEAVGSKGPGRGHSH